MPLMQSAADALPYIDAQPPAGALSAANTLVQTELDPDSASQLHPAISALREPNFSELMQAEHARLASGRPKGVGLDLSRYELLDPPAKGDTEAWRTTLQKAYVSAEYLRGREVNLGLLETYGKNAWLIGNSQLEDQLRALETELEQSKLDYEEVERARRATQGNVVGEMQALEEGWRTGVGRMIETQAAAERLRQEILEKKRMAAA